MSEDEQRAYRTIPQDACPECQLQDRRDHSVPVAINVNDEGTWVTVRYVCPKCRLVWECGWSDDIANEFADRFVSAHERVRAPYGEVAWPSGPSDSFRPGPIEP